MEYILISMLTITVFTYIVSIIANKILATPIHIKSLVLCACCALLISLILPRMFVGFAGLSGTLGILITFAMISSYFIAYYYDDAMQKTVHKEVTATKIADFSFSEILPEDKEEEIQLTVDLTTFLQTNNLEEILEEIPAIVEEPEIVADIPAKTFFYPMKCEEESEAKVESIIDFSKQIVLSEKLAENIIPTLIQPKELEDKTAPIVKTYYYPTKYEEDQSKLPVKIDEKAEVFGNLMNCKQEKKSIPATSITEKIPEIIIPLPPQTSSLITEVALPSVTIEQPLPVASSVQEIAVEKIAPEALSEDITSDSEDLDLLMDLAFSYKEQRNFVRALKTFRKALLLYPDSEVAPFLVVEIGTIQKNLGAYNEAIQVFMEGRSLPGVINNSILEQEFINNIAYLRVVKNILVMNSLGFIPFNSIPESALKEIDVDFREWRNQS